MSRLSIAGSLAAFGLATTANAQSVPYPPTDTATAESGDVVVTATRLPTDRMQVADSVTVITAQDIALKQQQTLPEALALAPGLNLVQTGGPGGLATVYIRGTNPNEVKVLVDGIDVGDPSRSDGSFDFGQFLTPDIERVEILRGPQSGLYGSDAIGGVINIITKSGEGPVHATAELEGGSFSSFNQNASLGGSTGPLHYMATIAHFESGATPVTPLDLLAPGEKRNDDAYDNVTASTKLGYDVAGNFDVGLVARYTDSRLRFTGDDDFTYGFPDPVQSQSDTRQSYARASAHLSLLDGRFDQTLGVAYSNLQTTYVTPNYGTSPFFGDRLKVDWQGDIKLADREILVIGAEHQSDAINRPLAANIANNSGYAELQSTPLTNLNDTISVRYDANSRFGGQVTYRFAPTYLIAATGTKIQASVGTGFKAPTLSQMYQAFPSYGFFGNPNLKPETSLGYDTGFEQRLPGDQVQFGATYFYNRITNLITDNASFTSFANIGKAHTDGVEGFVLVRPASAVSLRVDYTYIDAEDDVLHQPLVRRPHDKWTIDARWQATSQLSFDADLLSVSAWIDGNRDFSIQRLTAPGYATADLTANLALTGQLTLYGRITNLFDSQHQDPSGFLQPGRGAFAGLKVRL